MENGVGLFEVLIQVLHGLFRWENDQFDFAAPSLTPDLVHYRQGSGACADHQITAFPRYLFFQRERRMTEGVPKSL